MKITAGKYRGKILKIFNGFKERPTTDFAKEALFNIISNKFYFDDIKVLDLFSGTGNISFEFASRGTKNITLVDNNAKYVKYIVDNVEKIFKSVNFNCITADAFKFIEFSELDFDIIFADPPYKLKNIDKIPELIFKNKKLNKEVVFILEHSKYYSFKNHKFFDNERKYGAVHFSFFSNKNFN